MVCHEEGEFHGGTYDMYLSVVEWESLAVGHTKCISLSWGKVSGVSGGTHDIVQEFTGVPVSYGSLLVEHTISYGSLLMGHTKCNSLLWGKISGVSDGTHNIVREFTGGTHDIVRKFTGGTH